MAVGDPSPIWAASAKNAQAFPAVHQPQLFTSTNFPKQPSLGYDTMPSAPRGVGTSLLKLTAPFDGRRQQMHTRIKRMASPPL